MCGDHALPLRCCRLQVWSRCGFVLLFCAHSTSSHLSSCTPTSYQLDHRLVSGTEKLSSKIYHVLETMATAYRAERLKEQRGLRAKAPVAAQFEDCVQAFQQLSDSLQVKLSSSSLQKGSKDCYARLMLWAQESGASSRLLDYTLRGCPALKHQSLRLLEELLITLQKGTSQWCIRAWLRCVR